MGRLTFLILRAHTEQRFGKMDVSGQQLGGSFQSELSQRDSIKQVYTFPLGKYFTDFASNELGHCQIKNPKHYCLKKQKASV